MLVTPKSWDKAPKLHAELVASLGRTPPRRAYYPGAEERWKLLVESHANVERIGEAPAGALPWAIIKDLNPDSADERCFKMEPWCSVISETAIGSTDPVAFLDEAVKFCNERLWGTLAATIIIHPTSLKEPRVAEALERAIANLRYGGIGINHWPAMVYALGVLPWGGHPSSTLEDIQSGRGWVHNTLMLEGIEKSVVRGPLVVKPKPPWFAGHKTAHVLGRKMVALEAEPSWWKVPGLVINALRG
jgi:aldehyde dehydrogenase (NAD(P)+)